MSKSLGANNINKNMVRVLSEVEDSLIEALNDVGVGVMRLSMKYTPVHLGNLMGSHRISRKKIGSTEYVVIQVNANYAIWVHEAPPTTKFRSKWPRGRKFLQRAVDEFMPAAVKILAAAGFINGNTVGGKAVMGLPPATRGGGF